ncbi:Gfo/Idh/MocA family oxidoreductase [Actinopolymorpha sp. NPDC004070]|uniref:Gfo/Idh/MocA family protein n=1 Tax=Actinopolymorpha sp. NPDC004070 TaxID=3154548 RepID=UPI0033B5E417
MTIDVAVVGGRFGGEFLPLYRSHPDVGRVALCDIDKDTLHAVADRYGVRDRFDSLDALLASDRFDAVHVASPVRFHVDQSVAVLDSGRHCASAVPMATTLDGIRRVLSAQRSSGRTYMMMETMVFGREFFHVRDLYQRGDLGALTFLRGAHIQNLDGFPRYWYGYPPMTYSTHALSPLLALAGARVRTAIGLGSGRLTPDRRGDFGNPFPVETALFQLDKDDLAAEVTVSFFQTGRTYYEGFSVYGHEAGVEWPQLNEDDGLRVFRLEPLGGADGPGGRGRSASASTVHPPDRPDLLPPELAPFVRPTTFDPGDGAPAVRVGSAHGGSHPHLVHEFVTSIVESRTPVVDSLTAAAWTAPGICGHESALRNGERLDIPDFVAEQGVRT